MKILITIAQFLGLAILVTAVVVITLWLDARGDDGPSVIFRGGVFTSGEIYQGPEPDWSFVNTIPTIELQLVDPPRSRVIWTAEHEGKLYVWSGYMGTTVGRLWKRWPVQAERNGKAILRINDTRYELELIRIQSGDELDGITAAITNKYPSQTTRAAVETGGVWLFEAAPGL